MNATVKAFSFMFKVKGNDLSAFVPKKDIQVSSAVPLAEDPSITEVMYNGELYTTNTDNVIFPNKGTITA